jgi:hypothetical protein
MSPRLGGVARSTPWCLDPVRLGGHECDAWVAYYRRDWRLVLASAVGMVREGFGMPWPRTLLGAWYVLRANQVWAPFPVNDPAKACRLMARFYRLVIGAHGLDIEAEEAARLEVDWWREHRILQRVRTDDDEGALVEALTRLYAYVYGGPADVLRQAAHHRALAMRVSDEWVADGCRPNDPRVPAERAELVRSYTSLLRAVSSPSTEMTERHP